MSTHRHEAATFEDWGWTTCVDPMNCSGAAHGNITRREVCACGAQRDVEINGRHVTQGEWPDQAEKGGAR